MSPEKRQKVLVALLLVLAVFVGLRFVAPVLSRLAQGGAAGGLGGTTGQQALGAVAQEEIVDLRIGDLASPANDYRPGRNIFGYFDPPPPPPPPPPPQVYVAPPPPPPPLPPQGPQIPTIDFALLGIFGPDERRIAVLSDGEEIINALERDEVHDKFIVERIGLESIDLGFVDFPDEPAQTLEIGS